MSATRAPRLTEADVLDVLRQRERPATADDLARAVGRDRHTLLSVLGRLVESGQAERVPVSGPGGTILRLEYRGVGS